MKEFTRILKFTLCSVSAAVIEMAVFALLNEFTGLPYWPCYLVALVLSVLWNFTLNRTSKNCPNVGKHALYPNVMKQPYIFLSLSKKFFMRSVHI